jgi:hypothetical protein
MIPNLHDNNVSYWHTSIFSTHIITELYVAKSYSHWNVFCTNLEWVFNHVLPRVSVTEIFSVQIWNTFELYVVKSVSHWNIFDNIWNDSWIPCYQKFSPQKICEFVKQKTLISQFIIPEVDNEATL